MTTQTTNKSISSLGSFYADMDAVIDDCYAQMVRGSTFTCDDVRLAVLQSSKLMAECYDTNWKAFNAIYFGSFDRYRRNRVTVTAKSNGSRHVMDELLTITTRNGSVDNPAYIYIGNPTLSYDDVKSHFFICRRNIFRATKRLTEKEMWATDHFGTAIIIPTDTQEQHPTEMEFI